VVLITICGLPSDAWLRSVSNTRKNFSASMTVNLADLRSPDCIESDLSQSKHSHQLAANEFAWQSYVSVDFHIAVSTAFYRGGSPGSFVGTTVRRYVRSFEASKPQSGYCIRDSGTRSARPSEMKARYAEAGVARRTGDITYFHGRDDALVPSRVPAPLTKSFETRSGAPDGALPSGLC